MLISFIFSYSENFSAYFTYLFILFWDRGPARATRERRTSRCTQVLVCPHTVCVCVCVCVCPYVCLCMCESPCPSACPAPCSVWRAWGGEVRLRFPPTWLLLRGASEVRRSPSPDCPPTGRAVGVRHPRAVGAGVWVLGAQHCPLGMHALRGLRAAGVVWCRGVPGGGMACHCCEGRLVSGAVSPPTARPLGRAAGAPYPLAVGAGGCGRGDPSPNPQSALL